MFLEEEAAAQQVVENLSALYSKEAVSGQIKMHPVRITSNQR